MFDFSIVTQWVDTLLRSWMSPTAAVIVECVLVGVCLLLGYAVIALALIYVERKVCAFFQCRLGPNRVGPYGVIQSVADMFKMLIKEIIHINHIDKFLFGYGLYLSCAVGAFAKFIDVSCGVSSLAENGFRTCQVCFCQTEQRNVCVRISSMADRFSVRAVILPFYNRQAIGESADRICLNLASAASYTRV